MSARKLVGSVDQGTSSTRFILFDEDGAMVEKHQMEFEQIHPKVRGPYTCIFAPIVHL